MSLRGALDALSDDRETTSAVRTIIAFFEQHPDEKVTPSRISRATGLPATRVESVMGVLRDSYVLDCDDSDGFACVFSPSTVLRLEVQRYLRTRTTVDSRLQSGTERFRQRYGR